MPRLGQRLRKACLGCGGEVWPRRWRRRRPGAVARGWRGSARRLAWTIAMVPAGVAQRQCLGRLTPHPSPCARARHTAPMRMAPCARHRPHAAPHGSHLTASVSAAKGHCSHAHRPHRGRRSPCTLQPRSARRRLRSRSRRRDGEPYGQEACHLNSRVRTKFQIYGTRRARTLCHCITAVKRNVWHARVLAQPAERCSVQWCSLCVSCRACVPVIHDIVYSRHAIALATIDGLKN